MHKFDDNHLIVNNNADRFVKIGIMREAKGLEKKGGGSKNKMTVKTEATIIGGKWFGVRGG